jgi:hypothetical protein
MSLITKHDLDEAIAECQGQRNPNANTCIKLASFFIIRRELFEEDKEDEQFSQPMFSYSSGDNLIGRYGDSEFLEVVEGKPVENVMMIMDELMDSMQVLQPRIYDGVMRKIMNL